MSTPDKGILIVSLDLELYWGVRDIARLDESRDKLLAARAAVPRLLDLFTRHEIHATWATVGMLFFHSKEDLLRCVPRTLPRYARRKLSPYEDLETLGANETQDPFHFAYSLVRAIASTPRQEIGTHTFSHYYCLEDGQDVDTFRADLNAGVSAASRLGIGIESLVFPRNQVNEGYLQACAEAGIRVYRGNNAGWMHARRQRRKESQPWRGLRLLDCYLNLSGHNTYDPREITGRVPMELPSSRYLRMNPRWLGPLEPLRMRRLRYEMQHAARHGRVYHLWFHPEDIGADADRNYSFLEKVFEGFADLREEGAMESLNMQEFFHRFEKVKSRSPFCPALKSHPSRQLGQNYPRIALISPV